ncbi:MAG: adenosylcobinamide-phosphate synthase CbiB [Parasphingorhabdus sp.]|uniref:adenosylcobinamide-phosphate synthase CbiB n=1 Tax=Parasphingorhabdus sp. TaxID=2709688 RepID=UPI00300346CE
MAESVALFALLLDAAIGWPHWIYIRIGHPVGGFAHIINICEQLWNKSQYRGVSRRISGILTAMILLLVAGGTAWLFEWVVYAYCGTAGWPLLAIAAFPALAQRSLYDHVRRVAHALRAGELENGRAAVAMIVGRDTVRLDEQGIARAAIESLSESFCDGVVAPLFWLMVLGLPGIWIYKAVNTADSLIGHPEPEYLAFGWAAARCDDILNLIPARLSGVLICLAGCGGWRILWRDHAKHASPNAGWSEAAIAGALKLRLAGPISYDGQEYLKPHIGDGRSPRPTDICRALRLYIRASGLLWITTGGIIWLH